LQEADEIGGSEAEFAWALSTSFAWDNSPFDSGTVVWIEDLVTDTQGDPERVGWRYLEYFLRREFSHRASFICLKAFPTEFEGVSQVNMHPTFQIRYGAMIRLYKRRGAEFFSGEPSNSGWMFLELPHTKDEAKEAGPDER